MTADVIRPRLAAEFGKLKRDDQLRLALSGSATFPADVQPDDDMMIKKFANDVGSEGVLMPVGGFWLICQVCVIQHGPLRLWSKFSICTFQIDKDSSVDKQQDVAVMSNNRDQWTSLVHPEDNADLSSTTLAIVLHNDHYSSADILPRQNTGSMFHFGFVRSLFLPVSVP